MKEITDTQYEKNQREIKAACLIEGDSKGFHMQYGDSEIYLPKKVLKRLERKIRYFEVEDIGDLKENYDFLSEQQAIPLEFWVFSLLLAPVVLAEEKKQSLNASEKVLYEYIRGDLFEGGLLPTMNLRHMILDNVYLKNFEFIKKQKFEACEFEIWDTHGEYCEGVCVYKSCPPMQEDFVMERDLMKAMNAPGFKSFEIFGTAQVEGRTNPEGGLRGKKLYVSSIRYIGGDGDNREDIPHDNFIGLPTFARATL